ncbi:MAG TPA: ThiF family adenylyltransferase [Planctomycetota bacterium]|jgi:adenylyltransferase/sulfurtransferase|nr:ThiF family adenylyltransferase [Planctomycetota bacterium]
MNRYAKQILFAPLGKDGQERLGRSRVTIIGLGALGSTLANHLVRAGVGFVRLCDRDFVELDNLQRQVLYDEDDAKAVLPKAAAAAAKLARINSEVQLDPQICDVNYANVEALAKDVDLVLDGTDNFETRFILNDACVKLGRPWVYGGCVGSYGMVMTVLPGEGPCFACLVGGLPAPGSSPTCDTAGVLNTAASIVASLQANEAIKLLAGRKEALLGGLQTLDVWHNTQQLIRVPRSESCVACVKREFRHLEANPSGATSLCGRNAVQIVPPKGSSLDLAEAERRLTPLGKVRRNAYLLKLGVDGYELTLFADARAIVQGTDDLAKARSLYSRYVGS